MPSSCDHAHIRLPPWRCWCPGWPGSGRLARLAGVLLGTGPFVAYVASRTVGVPGDPSDVGNWGDWVGTASLVVEAALIALSASTLLALRQRLSYPVR